MNDKDRAGIEMWVKQRKDNIELGTVLLGTPEDAVLEKFCGSLMETAPFITVKSLENKGKLLPEIQVMENVSFSALPLEKLLPPFLESLDLAGGSPAVMEQGVKALLSNIDMPVDLKLYVASQCPHCPGVIRSMVHLAAASKQVHLHVIDGTWFDKAAADDGVLSAPCLILDNDFRWTGDVSMKEVVEMMIRRDPATLTTASLRRVLEEGNAAWIFEKMKAANVIFPGFIGLLIHEIWSVRLGAMVVVEELAQDVPDLALQLVPLILPGFEGADVTVKGDILYALGEVGDLSVADTIARMMATFEDEALVEAAEDALAAIKERA
ncbi:Thioredoxin domain-containing protein [Desulfocicer vacuolatum DSM 3385]|uniref:Thioredoxin domain-containing protein n=1 Tax=Desulfocicer vacuolatum DSM 3385 TaxID=1121400 RepID=A0A1W2A5H4_9BACT|nr:thioredoxin family protein [Desulfocicer vacuolatum]SMC55979.1 Thioredoxin domain-containing protein [Desulfocicer vacuolatum DSM 3385]